MANNDQQPKKLKNQRTIMANLKNSRTTFKIDEPTMAKHDQPLNHPKYQRITHHHYHHPSTNKSLKNSHNSSEKKIQFKS
jgi:hypothetical protein